jgi:type IV pilus assembly protein PilC
MIKTENISISRDDKLGTLSNLGTMLSAGIPLLESVEALLEDAKGNQKIFLETLRNDLTQGKHVYFTFSKFPNIFSKVVSSMVKASEEAGTLDVTLKDLKDNLKKDMEFSDKIRSAMIYPMFIAVLFVVIFLVMLTVVIPKISTVFSRMKVDLPLPTQIMITMSDALLKHTSIVMLCLVAFLFLIFILYKKQKNFVMNIFFKFPVIRNLIKTIDLTKFSRNFYLLLNAGIPITSALELTEDVVANNDVRIGIKNAKDTVASGKKLSEGFKNNRQIFPSMMIRITEAGERSGSLEKSMQEISDFMDYQVSGKLKTATALIEPLLLVVIGVSVGAMMVAIIYPIYSMIGNVGA